MHRDVNSYTAAFLNITKQEKGWKWHNSFTWGVAGEKLCSSTLYGLCLRKTGKPTALHALEQPSESEQIWGISVYNVLCFFNLLLSRTHLSHIRSPLYLHLSPHNFNYQSLLKNAHVPYLWVDMLFRRTSLFSEQINGKQMCFSIWKYKSFYKRLWGWIFFLPPKLWRHVEVWFNLPMTSVWFYHN